MRTSGISVLGNAHVLNGAFTAANNFAQAVHEHVVDHLDRNAFVSGCVITQSHPVKELDWFGHRAPGKHGVAAYICATQSIEVACFRPSW